MELEFPFNGSECLLYIWYELTTDLGTLPKFLNSHNDPKKEIMSNQRWLDRIRSAQGDTDIRG